jgi:aarF domain-containing kinase
VHTVYALVTHPTDPGLVISSEFSEEPVASASIAQVHRAVLADGTAVAVKVQKPAIADQMTFDLACYKMLVWAFERIFDLPLYWTVDFIAESVRREADFRLEAHNSDTAAADFEGREDIYIPKVCTQARCVTRDLTLVGDRSSTTCFPEESWLPSGLTE